MRFGVNELMGSDEWSMLQERKSLIKVETFEQIKGKQMIINNPLEDMAVSNQSHTFAGSICGCKQRRCMVAVKGETEPQIRYSSESEA